MTTYSMTEVIAAAKASNNGRLLSFAMTVPQKRAAEKAVAERAGGDAGVSAEAAHEKKE